MGALETMQIMPNVFPAELCTASKKGQVREI